MLSEEEKKAIDRLNEILREWQEIVNIENKTEREIEMSLYMEDMPFEEIKTVLNLITKLQKEIEHQKEKRENQKVELAILNEKQKEMNKLKNTVSSYYGMFKKQEKQIKELQKENEEKDKEIETLKRDFKIVDQECSRLERKKAKQDKIIDLMAEYMEENMDEYQLDEIYSKQYNCNGMKRNWTRGKEKEVKDIKQYFERKATNNG